MTNILVFLTYQSVEAVGLNPTGHVIPTSHHFWNRRLHLSRTTMKFSGCERRVDANDCCEREARWTVLGSCVAGSVVVFVEIAPTALFEALVWLFVGELSFQCVFDAFWCCQRRVWSRLLCVVLRCKSNPCSMSCGFIFVSVCRRSELFRHSNTKPSDGAKNRASGFPLRLCVFTRATQRPCGR
jgi:hypothetical protein